MRRYVYAGTVGAFAARAGLLHNLSAVFSSSPENPLGSPLRGNVGYNDAPTLFERVACLRVLGPHPARPPGDPDREVQRGHQAPRRFGQSLVLSREHPSSGTE